MGPDEPLVLSRQPPVFDPGEFSDVHPEDNRLVALGCLYVGTDGEPLWANADFHSQPREVWVGASDWVGVADYRCDGTADEIEINMALRFQQEVESSTIIRLSGGSFRCDKAIKGGLENILDGQGARTIIYAPPLTGFQNLAAQIRSLRHIDGDTDVVYASWGGGITTAVLYSAAENRDHAHASGRVPGEQRSGCGSGRPSRPVPHLVLHQRDLRPRGAHRRDVRFRHERQNTTNRLDLGPHDSRDRRNHLCRHHEPWTRRLNRERWP